MCAAPWIKSNRFLVKIFNHGHEQALNVSVWLIACKRNNYRTFLKIKFGDHNIFWRNCPRNNFSPANFPGSENYRKRLDKKLMPGIRLRISRPLMYFGHLSYFFPDPQSTKVLT